MKGVLAAAAALTVALAAAGERPAERAIPDREIGLAAGSVFEVPSPEPVADQLPDPGERDLLSRPYDGAPPRIPHAVSDYLPITRDENLCVDCHGIAEAGEGEPTPIPEDHYLDLRGAPEKRRERIAGARHNCLSCHVPLTAAEPLVGNGFASP